MKRALLLVPAAILVFSGMAFAQSKPADAPVKAAVSAGPQAQGPVKAAVSAGPNFVDANGDGICDLYQTGQGSRAGKGKGRRMGPADGTGNQGVGPRDGTGFGAKAGAGGGNGICDGTGKGRTGAASGRRGGRR